MSDSVIAVVAADLTQRSVLEHLLRREGFQVSSHASDGSLRASATRFLPEVVVVDPSLSAAHRDPLLDWCHRTHPRTPRLLLVDRAAGGDGPPPQGYGPWRHAGTALAPSEPGPELLAALRRTVDSARLARRVRCLERRVNGRPWGGLVGQGPALHELGDELDRVAVAEVNVLLHGEPGTGKALVARALHDESGRRDGPFVAGNGNGTGEERGASMSPPAAKETPPSPGVAGRRTSPFPGARGGTLFLPGLESRSPRRQGALLRAVRNRSAGHLDGGEPGPSDFRLVVSTHEPLREAVGRGRVSPELYDGIRGVEVRLPPLRERIEDLPLLVDHFVRLEAPDRAPLPLSREAAELMRAYPWPGNLRELRDVVRRALITCQGGIDARDLPPRVRHRGRGPAALSDDEPGPLPPDTLELGALERWAVRRALAVCAGNVTEAAARLGIGRTTLYRKLDAYGLR